MRHFVEYLLVARRRDDIEHVSFYSKNSHPDHQRHGFVSNFQYAYRFENEEQARDIAGTLFRLPERQAGRNLYPHVALSAAFNLPHMNAIEELGYFTVIPVVADLESEVSWTIRAANYSEHKAEALEETERAQDTTHTYPSNLVSPGGF